MKTRLQDCGQLALRYYTESSVSRETSDLISRRCNLQMQSAVTGGALLRCAGKNDSCVLASAATRSAAYV